MASVGVHLLQSGKHAAHPAHKTQADRPLRAASAKAGVFHGFEAVACRTTFRSD